MLTRIQVVLEAVLEVAVVHPEDEELPEVEDVEVLAVQEVAQSSSSSLTDMRVFSSPAERKIFSSPKTCHPVNLSTARSVSQFRMRQPQQRVKMHHPQLPQNTEFGTLSDPSWPLVSSVVWRIST